MIYMTDGELKQVKCRATKKNAQTDDLYTLAQMYYEGSGVKQNLKKALKLFKLVAERNDSAAPHALLNLGEMYQKGEGCDRSLEKASQFYQSAADLHYAFAEYKLGMMYEHGLGVTKSLEIARKWYKVAAAEWVDDVELHNSNQHAQDRLDCNVDVELYWTHPHLIEQQNELCNAPVFVQLQVQA